MKKWPDLKVVKPQKLAMSRAKCASKENLDNYFKELGTILSVNDFKNRLENNFNTDETGVNTEYSSP